LAFGYRRIFFNFASVAASGFSLSRIAVMSDGARRRNERRAANTRRDDLALRLDSSMATLARPLAF